MEDRISVVGITTHNLKNIDITLEKNSINLILGPSGSGKSSLAYDTIAQIGLHEYNMMYADNISEPIYEVKGYENMCVTVPIKQINLNNNMRSTIASYFGIRKKIIFLFADILQVDPSIFSLELDENVCKMCHGLGYVKKLDETKIVMHRKKISENPFRCWQRYGDFYSKILVKYCEEIGIDANKTLTECSEIERKKILYGESKKSYKISYMHGKNRSTRTTKYYGVMTEKPMRKNFSPTERFYSNIVCPKCKGLKYGEKQLSIKIDNLSIGMFMQTPFEKLKIELEKIKSRVKEKKHVKVIEEIDTFIKKAIELKLGHLCFSRAIPTLSGGELQRLRMIPLFVSQLNNLMVILDEPLAGLSGKEKELVYKNVLKLAPKHTVVIVDHSEKFVKAAKRVYTLGNGSGYEGGYIVDTEKYLLDQRMIRENRKEKVAKLIEVDIRHKIYGFTGIDIKIGLNRLNLITGPSGVGKTTILKEYFSRYFDEYLYIDQKTIVGNSNSCVATLLGVANLIFSDFAKKYGEEKAFFSNNSNKAGACKSCGGVGYYQYSNNRVICSECKGSGFSKILKEYTLSGKNIFEIWKMTVDEAIDFFECINKKVYNKLKCAKSLALGHLQIGQPTSTLSGGENVRIKLINTTMTEASIIGIDEPFKGLNLTDIYKIINFLWILREKGKTIVVIDHTENVKLYFDNHIEIKLLCNKILKGERG